MLASVICEASVASRPNLALTRSIAAINRRCRSQPSFSHNRIDTRSTNSNFLLAYHLTPAAHDSFGLFRPLAHDHFDLLLSGAAIERHDHFAAWSDGADVAVEFVGRLHRMAVELGDEVARS